MSLGFSIKDERHYDLAVTCKACETVGKECLRAGTLPDPHMQPQLCKTDSTDWILLTYLMTCMNSGRLLKLCQAEGCMAEEGTICFWEGELPEVLAHKLKDL